MQMSNRQENLAWIDGPNVDSVLGRNVLGHQPEPHERPRWDRFHAVLQGWYGVKQACFVLNGDHFTDGVFRFYRALREFGYEIQAPRNGKSAKSDPVDEYIISAIRQALPSVRTGLIGKIILCTHDGDFAPVLREVHSAGGQAVVFGFREETSPALLSLEAEGAELVDLEFDAEAFNITLNRPYQPTDRERYSKSDTDERTNEDGWRLKIV